MDHLITTGCSGLGLAHVFFGFLRLCEATVPSLEAYNSSVHLSVANISIDSRDCPMVVIVRIKATKTDRIGPASPFTWVKQERIVSSA